MRIVGKGHDYYDSALAYGHDPSIVYVRQPRFADVEEVGVRLGRRVEVSCVYEGDRPSWRTELSDRKLWLFRYPIVLAGKLYPMLRVFLMRRGRAVEESFDCFSAAEVWDGLRDRGVVDAESDAGFRRLRERRHRWNDVSSVEEYFERRLSDDEVSWLVENGVTALRRDYYLKPDLYRGTWVTRWVIEPTDLKDFGLPRVLPPTQAFQEVEQWVSGVLPRAGAPMVQITDDKVKIHKAGFDTKFSFRKSPEE